MTNTVNRGENNYNLWVDIVNDDESGRSLQAYSDDTGVDFSIYGRTYIDRDNYKETPSEDFSLNLEEVIELRNYLDAVIARLDKGAD